MEHLCPLVLDSLVPILLIIPLSPFKYDYHSTKTDLDKIISDLYTAKCTGQFSVLFLLDLPAVLN